MFLRLLFKRPADFWGRAICWKTGGPYCHTELWFDGEPTAALCFSSRENEGSGFKIIDLTQHDWDFVEITFDPQKVAAVYKICQGLSGRRYDWLGVLAFEIHWLRDDADDLFCSESCALALRNSRLLVLNEDAAKVSPYELSLLVSKVYGEPAAMVRQNHYSILVRPRT